MMNDYDKLALRAEQGGLPLVPGTVVRGEVAAAQGRQLLIDATGTRSIEDAITAALLTTRPA